MYLVIDSNIVLRSFGFIEQLQKAGAVIVIPRSVVEELQNSADLERLKKLRARPQNGETKKWTKTIALALKRWPQIEEKIRKGEWLVRGSYGKRIVSFLIKEVKKLGLKSISVTDLRVVATALALNGAEKVKLLSLDKELIQLARAVGINVPPTHGWEKHFWKEEILKF